MTRVLRVYVSKRRHARAAFDLGDVASTVDFGKVRFG